MSEDMRHYKLEISNAPQGSESYTITHTFHHDMPASEKREMLAYFIKQLENVAR